MKCIYFVAGGKHVLNTAHYLKQPEEFIRTVKGGSCKTPLGACHLPGVVSSRMSKEYTGLENLGVWSFTSLMVILILMSEDWRPSSARTSNEYLDLCSLSSLLVAMRSPDSGSIRKLSSAPLMSAYVTRAFAPWRKRPGVWTAGSRALFLAVFCECDFDKERLCV